MFLYDFYVKYFGWLTDLVCIGKFLPNVPDGSALNELPIQILKLIFMMPFLMIVMWIPILFVFKIGAWMIGCWFGAAENIYED